MAKKRKLPKIGLLYLDYVLRFFDKSNFRGWPDKIETAVYHWGKDKDRFIREVRQKKIDVLIGNIPATAYETFREIARELPHVRFIPSLDAQFSNKSKENVTRFCQKYNIPIPKTKIIYDLAKADNFLKKAKYPKIIKRSYGPSNYGGFFVHKVDSYLQAKDLITKKRYFPLYIQDFIPMEADVRVMLIGHRPVCAFWRRPPEGDWLTNTSQGGTMDYSYVPKKVLNIAVKASKAANAEYFACDVAVGKDGRYRILECATAFAAFPYIRDWIGQYIMWKLSKGYFKKPYVPLYSWEELGKIDPSLLRTMRYIGFGKYSPSFDGEYFTCKDDDVYQMVNTKELTEEEWPSEVWNFQDKFSHKIVKKTQVLVKPATEDSESPIAKDVPISLPKKIKKMSKKDWMIFLEEVKGIGKKLSKKIVDKLGKKRLIIALHKEPKLFEEIKGLKEKKIARIKEHWLEFIAK